MKKKRIKYTELVPIINDILGQYDYALTVRQIFYRLVSDPYNYIDNTINAYTNLDSHLVKMREEGAIPYNRIVDRTRKATGGDDEDSGNENTYIHGQIEGLRDIGLSYSKPMWETQKNYIEVWIEKDALIGSINGVTAEYNLTAFACRGYGSFSSMMDAINRFSGYPDKEKIILYFGDHDPTGLNITEVIQRKLIQYGGDVEVRKIALSYEQVQEFNLTPLPTKKKDTRTNAYLYQYGDQCWELDALPPDEIPRLLEEEVKKYIDFDAWEERKEEIQSSQDYIDGEMEKVMDKFEEKEEE